MATEAVRRLTNAREYVLREYPFFGSLLMHLKLALSKCKTAYTDMERLVFDPDFLAQLNNEELIFVMNHEVLHVALFHCVRAKGHQTFLFNVACDIVVNSILMRAMDVEHFYIQGEEVIHKAPDGKEGYWYDVETVYKMLAENGEVQGISEKGRFDSHSEWEKAQEFPSLLDRWEQHLQEAKASTCGVRMIPHVVRNMIENKDYRSKHNWRQVLERYVQYHFHDFDYTYRPPNAACLEQGFVIPSFKMTAEETLEKIWFFIDTSASVTDTELTMVFMELQQILMQYPGMTGYISFFDTKVTQPEQFQSIRELSKIKPKGGGGTSFDVIFEYIKENRAKYDPKAIVIVTDGHANFPFQSESKGIPVLWIMVESGVVPPWGEWACIHYNRGEEAE